MIPPAPTSVPLRLFIVLVALTTTAAPLAAEDLIGLYLTWRDDPTTTMTITDQRKA